MRRSNRAIKIQNNILVSAENFNKIRKVSSKQSNEKHRESRIRTNPHRQHERQRKGTMLYFLNVQHSDHIGSDNKSNQKNTEGITKE